MITAPTNWNNLWGADGANMEVAFAIGGKTYYNADIIGGSLKLTSQLYKSFGIGNACASMLQIELVTDDEMPSGAAQATLKVRLKKGSTTTSWVVQGTYYLDTAEITESGTAKLTLYDGMALTDRYLYTGGKVPSSETYPKNALAVATAIASLCGLSLDQSNKTLWQNVSCTAPTDMTCRQILQAIGAAAGGNWTITKANKLKFIPLGDLSTATQSGIVAKTRQFSQTSTRKNILAVALHNGNETYTQGSGGFMLNAACEFASEANVLIAYNAVRGKQYQGFKATNAVITPLVELGDLIDISGARDMLVDSWVLTYQQGCWGNLEAPMTDEVEKRIGELDRQAGIARINQAIQQLSDIQDSIDSGEIFENIIDQLNAKANETGGWFYYVEGQGVRTYDKQVTNPAVGAEATQVVEIKGGNIRIANSKDNKGNWQWKTVLTSGHIAAELVTAAALTAGYIGNIDGTYWDLDNNTLVIGNNSTVGGMKTATLIEQVASSVSDANVQYYLSTSSTSQTGGSWGSSMPKVTSGKYLWERQKIVKTDGSIVYTTPVLATAINSAQTSANDAATAAGNAQTTANVANTAAGNAQSTANAAQTAAGNAQTTANAANTAAGNAQSTANAAQTAAGNAQTAADNAQTTANGAQTVATRADERAVAYRGECGTGATTVAKVVTAKNFLLTKGVTITVYNTTANTSTGALTLNVNSTGAKPIFIDGAAASSTNQLLWVAGSMITYTYDGTNWCVQDPGVWYGTESTAGAGTAAKATTAKGCVIRKGTTIYVPFTNANTNTTATLNVGSTGAKEIYYGTTTTRPTTANGYGWIAGTTAVFVFDGATWRTGDSSAAQKANDAAKVATNYLTFSETSGLDVGYTGTKSKARITGSGFEVFNSASSSVAYMGLQDNVAITRVGLSSRGHFIASGEGWADVRHGSTVLAHFGYAEGNAQEVGSRAIAPYYSLGVRLSDSDIGNYSVAEGDGTEAIGFASHAEGYRTKAGYCAHAEGGFTEATGKNSHAEGSATEATADYSHAEGSDTKATADFSHAEGSGTDATGECSHAEGDYTKAIGRASHAGGVSSEARGEFSHASGFLAIANRAAQTVIGRYNVIDEDDTTASINGTVYTIGKYAFIVGNGTIGTNRKNALALDWSGNLTIAGKLNKGGVPDLGDTYLKLSGGTLTGSLIVSGSNDISAGRDINAGRNLNFGSGAAATQYVIAAKTPSRNARILFVGGGKKTDGDANGTVVGLGAGGLTLVGGGEYATNRYNVADLDDGTEALYMGADTAVYIESNANNITNRKTFAFRTSGSLEVPNNALVKHTGVDVTLADNGVTANQTRYFEYIDANDRMIACLQGTAYKSGSTGAAMMARNVVDGANVDNNLYLTVSKAGVRGVGVSDPGPWRTALGLGSLALKDSLEAADIPNLNTSKLTAGTLGVARGGTGLSTIASGSYMVGNGTGAVSLKTPAQVLSDIGAAAASDLVNYLPLAGGTLTGEVTSTASAPLTLKNTTIDTSQANNGLSSNSYKYIRFYDKNNRFYAWVTGYAGTNGETRATITARNFGTGSNVDNYLALSVKNDGTRAVAVSEAAPWRTALGLGTLATKSSLEASDIPDLGAGKITSGTFAADRIPTLAIGTKTSGTLAIDRGGTGQTGTTYTSTIADIATAGTGFTISAASVARWGKVVVVYLAVKNTDPLTANTEYAMATIKDAYLPKTVGPVSCTRGSGIITSGGAVQLKVREAVGAGGTAYLSATYVLA